MGCQLDEGVAFGLVAAHRSQETEGQHCQARSLADRRVTPEMVPVHTAQSTPVQHCLAARALETISILPALSPTSRAATPGGGWAMINGMLEYKHNTSMVQMPNDLGNRRSPTLTGQEQLWAGHLCPNPVLYTTPAFAKLRCHALSCHLAFSCDDHHGLPNMAHAQCIPQ